MKKWMGWLLLALEAACWGGAWAVRRFTRRKIGMMRFVAHESRRVEAAIPAELLHILLVAAGGILLVLLLLVLLRGAGKLSPVQKGVQACYLVVSALVVWFLIVNTRQTCSYYYFVSPLMLLALLLRLVGARLRAGWMGTAL